MAQEKIGWTFELAKPPLTQLLFNGGLWTLLSNTLKILKFKIDQIKNEKQMSLHVNAIL